MCYIDYSHPNKRVLHIVKFIYLEMCAERIQYTSDSFKDRKLSSFTGPMREIGDVVLNDGSLSSTKLIFLFQRIDVSVAAVKIRNIWDGTCTIFLHILVQNQVSKIVASEEHTFPYQITEDHSSKIMQDPLA